MAAAKSKKKGGRKGKATKKQLAALARGRATRKRNLAAGGRRTKARSSRRTKSATTRTKRSASRRKVTVMGAVGAKRKRGKVVGVLNRKMGHLYYVTKNGSIVETPCVRGGCRKSKPGVRVSKGKFASKRSNVRLRAA